MKDRLIRFILKLTAIPVAWYLDRSGVVDILYRNDAAIIFREEGEKAEVVFPWHLQPEGDGEHEMPTYLGAAMHITFAMQKEWLMRFIGDYMSDPEGFEDSMAVMALTEMMKEHQEHHVHVEVEETDGGNGRMDEDDDRVLH